jgi:hypothetical protein
MSILAFRDRGLLMDKEVIFGTNVKIESIVSTDRRLTLSSLSVRRFSCGDGNSCLNIFRSTVAGWKYIIDN